MAGTRSTKFRRKTLKVSTKEPCNWLETVLIMVILYIIEVNGNLNKVSIDKLKAESQTANEGEQVILHCYFTPTNADIGKWYWKTNGSAIARSDQLDPKSRYSLANATEGTGNASLIIKSVTRWDKGKYICGVDDESTTSSVAQSDVCWLTVYYMENPKLEALGAKYVPGGAKVSLQCKLALSYPEVTTINWFHGNKKIEDDSDKYGIEDDILEITQFDKRDEGNYTCRAENEVFAKNNGKSSNSIMFSLRKEAKSSMPIAWIPVTFIIVFGIITVIGYVFYNKKQSAKLEDEICQAVTSFMTRTKAQTRIDQDIPDLDIVGKNFVEAFKQKSLQIKRGDSIKISFNSTYNSDHWCFQELPGYRKPTFCINLELHRYEEGNVILYTSGNIKQGTCKRSSEFGSNDFCWEVNEIKYGVKGQLAFKNITDDDEGRYLCRLQINWEKREQYLKPITKFTFYGKTNVSLTNVIFRNVQRNAQLRPMRLILSNNFYLFVEDESEVRYIMSRYDKSCEDAENIQQHQALNYPALTWDDDADFLMESKKEMVLQSFAILPGVRNPYIVLGFISHGKNILERKLVAIFPKRSAQFHVISGVLETLSSYASVGLKFDNLSGMKLSTGRLVVGGWIKRREVVVDNNQTSKWKVKYLGTTPTDDNLMDIENQSYEYEPFIMWTDDEINWNLLNLKMDNAVDNMRFQITETCPSTIHVIISSLSSNQILYEGTSNDNCQTFTKNSEKCFEVPLVSFGLSPDGSFVCAPYLKNNKYTSDNDVTNVEKQQIIEASVGDVTDSGVVRPSNESTLLNRLSGYITRSVVSNSEGAPAGKTIESREQKTEIKETNEESSLISDAPSETSEATLDPVVIDTTSEHSPESTSENHKKRSIFKNATSKLSKPVSALKRKSKVYEPLSPIEEGSKENSLPTEDKCDSLGTREQKDELEIQPEAEAEEKHGKKSEIVMSDLETRSMEKETAERKGSTLQRVTGKIPFLKKKKDEKEAIKGNVSEECIDEEPHITDCKQESEETNEQKDEIAMSGLESKSKNSLETSENPKKQKSVKRNTDKRSSKNQSCKPDEHAPTNDNAVKKAENQTLNEDSLEQNEEEDKTDASNYVTSNEKKSSSKNPRSKIRNIFFKWKSPAASEPYEGVMVSSSKISTKKEEKELGGFWHLIQDMTDNTAIRVRPVRDGDPSDYGQVTILKNRSKVKCNQILPFTHEGRSLFLMIYSTDFHKEEDVSTWRCTRYHVFSVADLFK